MFYGFDSVEIRRTGRDYGEVRYAPRKRVSDLPNLPNSKSDPKSLTSQSITRYMRDVRQLLISSLVSCSLNISLRM